MAFMARHSSSVMLELSCATGAPFVSVDSTGVGLPDALLAAMMEVVKAYFSAKWQVSGLIAQREQCAILGATVPGLKVSRPRRRACKGARLRPGTEALPAALSPSEISGSKGPTMARVAIGAYPSRTSI